MQNLFWSFLIFILTSTFTSPLQASIGKLLKELNEKNETILRSRLSLEITKLEREELYANRSWNSLGQITHKDDLKEGVSLFDANATLTDTFNVGLEKQFFTGTKTSFKHQITHLDRSRWNPALIGNGPAHLYTTSNTFNLEQEIGKNIFGKIDRLELANAQLKVKNMEQKILLEVEQIQEAFYQTYLITQYHKGLLDLKNKAMERAIKRKDMVQKRVQEGLQEKVDLIESKSNILSQQEACISLQQTLQDDLQNLSQSLHRKVTKEEISPINLSEIKTIPQIPQNLLESLEENNEIKKLRNDLLVLQESKKKVELDFFPQFQIQGEFTSIKNNHQLVPSVEKAIPGASPYRQFKVGLLLTMPLDFPRAKIEKSKLAVQILSKQTQIDKKIPNLQVYLQAQKEKLDLLEKSFSLATQRLQLAHEVLQEHYRLYQQARKDLDSVLSAEVSLISTEESLLHYAYNFESILAKYQLTLGKFSSFVQAMIP